jgi:predicted pyridoxine 5'-phosphate oxidase superfamily flavin-nucleotide-binding protein
MEIRDLKELIESSTIAFTTSSKDGRPNCIVVDGVKVLNEEIVITDNFMNKTRVNLQNNSQVSLVFWSDDKTQAYQIKGTAEVFLQGEYKKLIDEAPENQGLAKKAAIVITPIEIWDLYDPKLIYKN